MKHYHTKNSQPSDYRKHLKEDHDIELNEDIKKGTHISSSRQLVQLHQKAHPDHIILIPSFSLVKP
jgi:hypothetical protein